ncbi:MAG: hypothetical protein ACRD2F_14680, partial [Terriglobales bacterium]
MSGWGQILLCDALVLGMFAAFGSAYGAGIYGPRQFRRRGWPLLAGFWLPTVAIAILAVDLWFA